MDVVGSDAAVGAASPEGSRKSYDAFISYAHGADKVFAPVLQRGLQHLAKPWNRRRAMELFRDETSLAASPGLWPSIRKALDASRWFVLLASPEAARSEWRAEGHIQPSLSERIFARRAELLYLLDHLGPQLEPATEDEDGTHSAAGLRRDVAARLRAEVEGMDPRNIEVRRHLRTVDTYREPASWEVITPEKQAVITGELAGLPTAYQEDEHSEEAKRFDYMLLRLQLAYLNADPDYVKLRGEVQTIASALLDDTTLSIPAVREQRRLLDEVAGDDWWQDVTLPMLETVRRRLRGLVKLLPRIRRGVVYFDFEDEQGEIRSTEIRGMPPGASTGRFIVRVRGYLRTHEHDPIVVNIRSNQPVDTAELASLATVFVESGFGSEDDIEAVTAQHGGFGLFLRLLTGLDHDVAAAAFVPVTTGRELNPPQRAYVQLLIDVLAKNGLLKVEDLYSAPFTLRAPHGPEDLFSNDVIDRMADALTSVRANAQPDADSAG